LKFLNYTTKKLPVFLTLLLLSAFLPLPLSQAADQLTSVTHSQNDSSVLTFGSQIVLDACWSPADLESQALGKKLTTQKRSPAPPPPSANCKNTLPPLSRDLQNSIRSVTPAEGRKLVALTFDLCEGKGELAGYDADIVDFLRASKVKATFFAGGKWLQSHPDRAMQLMADPLFEIGNHSWNHPNFRLISEAAMHEQIVRTQAQYEIIWEDLATKVQEKGIDSREMNQIPKIPLTFRFPFGTCSEQALRLTAALGLPAIQWNIVTADSCQTQTAEKIAWTIVKRAKPGAIVIMHANGKGIHTARALALCVPKLQNQGYQFVTVSELLLAGPVFSTATCYEEKPNDNLRYDRINRKK
jgi:peptidoglycan/xylan/chitin deacetylase (PgdA/CDA1 family)